MRYVTVLFLAAVFAAGAVAQSRQPPKRPATVAEQVDGLRSDVDALSKRVEALEAEIQVLRQGPREAAAPGDADEAKAIADGLRDGKVAVGMTVKQVEKIVGTKGELRSESGGAQQYTWFLPPSLHVIRDGAPSPQNGSVLIATFQSGKLQTYRTQAAYGAGAGSRLTR